MLCQVVRQTIPIRPISFAMKDDGAHPLLADRNALMLALVGAQVSGSNADNLFIETPVVKREKRMTTRQP